MAWRRDREGEGKGGRRGGWERMGEGKGEEEGGRG